MTMRQEEVEWLVLKALYALANEGTSWVSPDHVAGIVQEGISTPRVQMALRTLESARHARARHNVNTGSTYEITEAGYKKVEAEREDQSGEEEFVSPDAPAADRIVGFDHNSRSFREVRAKISELQDDLGSANDLGELTERSASVAAAEVEAIGRTMDQEFFRPAELWARAKMTLGWIGREAAGALVGTAAVALLALLASFLGFPVV